MKSELIVDAGVNDITIALLEDGKLVSLQKENRDQNYSVGNMYIAKVKKLMPGLNAAFVDVGSDKDAFLHYLDLGSHFSTYSDYIRSVRESVGKQCPPISKAKSLPRLDKDGAIADVLSIGQELLVQVAKEPISSKGPRLSTEISLTGRYMVLIPFASRITVSQKIKSQTEKARLKQTIESIKPNGFSVIIRTSAEGRKVAELDQELRMLVKTWDGIMAKFKRSTTLPTMVFEEDNRALGVIRDLFNPSFDSIQVNDKDLEQQLQKYVHTIAPDREDVVKLYESDEPIFDHFNVTRQIKSSLGKTVSFKNGAYIIIEHTEALHVVDVNSGNRTKAGSDQETNALEVNLRAADEIARQLRLRDMGGIIVIDFIDMSQSEHRQALYDHMRTIMKNDRARHNILPLSKFGLMQITRQRVRPAQEVTAEEVCPSCLGTGKVTSSLLFTDTIREQVEYVFNEFQLNNLTIYVHPFVEAYLKKGVISQYRKWKFASKCKFKIVADQSLAYLQFKMLDKNKQEIDIKRLERLRDAEESVEEPKSAPKKARKSKPKKKRTKEAEPSPQKQSEPTMTAENTADNIEENLVKRISDNKPSPKRETERAKKAKETSPKVSTDKDVIPPRATNPSAEGEA